MRIKKLQILPVLAWRELEGFQTEAELLESVHRRKARMPKPEFVDMPETPTVPRPVVERLPG